MFYPSTRKEVTALLKYIENNAPAIARRRKGSAYRAAVNSVCEQLRASFAARPATLGACRWREIGVYSVCGEIAEQFQVPLYDVVHDANPLFNK